ncbi:uncharacterized protein LOC120774988 [Bactrocera tryoni]|uniref:uncharacterized protein LOC120774988 n=1 Tax=Bactrocera tryoni TaxID=59916 RepID=UPI001A998BE2|nr:uncharacterized protein LOC120774988 [Bactrocera tryoni]
MNRIEIVNLIDLSIEDDDKQIQTLHQSNASPSSLPNPEQSIMECTLPDFLIIENEGRESLDNNPFDLAQKLSTRPEDPFDLVEKEASVKARYSMQPKKEVKVGKLLSLSDDNILDDNGTCPVKETATLATLEKSDIKNIIDMTASNCSISIYHSALVHELDSESPPISMSIKSTPDTCSSAIESDESSANSADGYSARIRKAMENRKRLLKLSIANSTFNSPLSCRSRQTDSGFSTAFSAAAHFSDYMLATESPLKLVDDDLLREEPPKLSDAENDFEADLEMLSIPMLRKLPSPVPEETSLLTREAEDVMPAPQNLTVPDLSALREKLRAKRVEACKGQDVVSLIDNLKSLLCDNEIVDDDKKEKANCLLKKLSTALNTEKCEDNNDELIKNIHDSEPSTQVPQTIVRQGTFDMELETKSKNGCDKTSGTAASVDDNAQMTHSIQSTQSSPPAKEIPEVMLKSSGTFDGEPVSERENLLLPHVDALSPITSPILKPSLQNTAATNPDVNDIIEQIGKLLEQHQIAASSMDATKGNNSSGNNPLQQSTMCNPTFIVVMPTNSVQPTNTQDINTSNCNVALDDMDSNIVPRRRAQSLSIHDKVKIVQLPIRSQAAPYITGEVQSPLTEGASQINTSIVEMKTPIRSTQRRNSFSSGTPHTPLSSLTQGAGATNSRRLQNTSTIQSRYSLGPSKLREHESQQHAVLHPISRTNLNVFKPDLKKRTKTQTTKTSIMASNGPLKAVMPIKKVAPMLTTTIATPEGSNVNSRIPSQTINMETSMNLLTMAGKLSNTSTPMPPTRSGEQISGFPNACSTPAICSIAKRPNGTITKKNPRFSVSTPSKLQQPLVNTSGVKKRALPELTKTKSPVRSRKSLSGMSVPVVRGRQSMVKQQNVSKQTTSRLSTRLSTRSSLCPASTSTNKENKKP